jgi:hypothetical protein
MDKETALRMARKLAAINGSNATEAEAVLAAEHLARISAQHGFTKLDFTPEQVKKNVGSEQASHKFKKVPDWIQYLTSRVVKAMACECVFLGDTGLIDVMGDETEVTLCKYFLEVLIKEAPKINWRWRVASGLVGTGQNPARKQSWYRGFTDAVVARLEAIYGHFVDGLSDDQKAKRRGLIVVGTAAIAEFKHAKYPRLGTMKMRQQRLDHDAYAKGHREGTNVRLQEAVK